MRPEIEEISASFKKELKEVKTLKEVEGLEVNYLGRKGPMQALMPLLKSVSPEERPLLGKAINDLKEFITLQLAESKDRLLLAEENNRLKEERLDVTLPGRPRSLGNTHPLQSTLDRILDIFIEMGFSVQLGPDIDTDYYNFEVLNFPPDHPARDMQDTFYLEGNYLLRTHTSNVQARVMEANRPPIRVVSPGKTYRNETITARSHVVFHQIEGFYVDKGVTYADFVSTFDAFLGKLFHQGIKTRYRTSYFPFVEPGLEVDVSCLHCHGKGCNICKYSGWLEIAGAGMIHPEVLKNTGIDPEIYSGFAWGMGVARLLMIERGIPDIRLFFDNDDRFLRQF
jgi:phenylalanyl-tRNA synthetase alpha chain